MILYHGSNIAVRKPDLSLSRRALDFGAGFYLTTDLEQAGKWAVRAARNRKSGQPLISVYETTSAFSALYAKHFPAPNREWLEFVTANRLLKPVEAEYDIVSGPVADDQTIDVLNIYFSGTITADMALQLLLPQKLKDQWVIKTQAGLEAIQFKEVIAV